MTDEQTNDERRFWDNILRAVHTTPRRAVSVAGASGLSHNVMAIGVDDASKRLVVVSPEHDGRTAALVQSDIQGAYTDYRVLTIRPAAVSVSKLAQAIRAMSGSHIMTQETFDAIQKDQSQLHAALTTSIGNVVSLSTRLALRKLPQILEFIQQLGRLNITAADLTGSTPPSGKFAIDLSNLLSYDPIAADREVGVCGFPFYDFSDDAVDSIVAAPSAEAVAETLRQRDIFQYFYPAPDHVALGLVERGISKPSTLTSMLDEVPQLGHPYGQTEIVEAQQSVIKAVNALQTRSLLVEGEFGFELTDEGMRIRSTVRFKPKEGLVSKLINRFSLKIDLKDLFGGTKGGD
jgi:hypothetical protein